MLRFDLSPEDHSNRPLVTVLVQPRPARFNVHGCSRNRHDHRLGHTQLRARRITLWSEQVARAVDGDWDRTEPPDVDDGVYARALGRVLAHELGHVLLRLDGHRERGLMRPAFSHRSLTARGRRAFRLPEEDLQTIRDTLLMLKLDNVRKGFFERDQFRGRADHLPGAARPGDVRLPYRLARSLGVLPLRWAQVDRTAKIVRLEPGETKNGEGRTLPYNLLPELSAVVESQWRELCHQVERGYGGSRLTTDLGTREKASHTACRP